MYKSCVLRSILSRIQLAPHARRKAVPITESGWIPVLGEEDEVAKSGDTGITNAYTDDIFFKKGLRARVSRATVLIGVSGQNYGAMRGFLVGSDIYE